MKRTRLIVATVNNGQQLRPRRDLKLKEKNKIICIILLFSSNNNTAR